MRESRYAKHFNLELERINPTIESNDELKLSTCMEEAEIIEELAPLLELAETLKGVDFSGESRINKSLLQRLLQKFPGQMPNSTNYKPPSKTELSDDELDRAAGGVTGQQTNDTGCSLCSCRRPAATIERDNCPNCGHHRSGHK